ncbi:hypothetical protein [Paenibacillus lentus]|uniref:hypothetical protein n=1 Tax=Paenibacillus lentus TaxID=1338368 RepID=UPI001B87B2E5|nr:hypothetical protein [Paenibacillus lentus]
MREHKGSVLNTDSYDRRRFGQLFEMSEKLREVDNEGSSLFPSFRPLMGDMWAGLFKMKPELLEDVPAGLEMNHQLMEQVMSDQGYQEFREFTRLDDLAAALGTTKYSETVLGWVKEQAQRDQDLADALQNYMKGKQGASQEAAEALSSALNQQGGSLSRMLSQAAQEATEAKENVKSLLGGMQAGSGDE